MTTTLPIGVALFGLLSLMYVASRLWPRGLGPRLSVSDWARMGLAGALGYSAFLHIVTILGEILGEIF